ncbi:MAG TPA: HD domain-containing protein [Acidimicrobiales bacterium]|jgi:predicted HD phosphohydrolase
MATNPPSDHQQHPLSIDEIEQLLTTGADRPVEISDTTGQRVGAMAHSQLDHAIQTAAQLKQWAPDDEELQVAGLVHDIGQLMEGVGDVDHPAAGAAAVRQALGQRVAQLVALHVEAKRYLVAKEGQYNAALAADSVASLALQGGPMLPSETTNFEQNPHFADAVLLRRADESAKIEGLQVAALGQWMEIVRRVHTHQP